MKENVFKLILPIVVIGAVVVAFLQSNRYIGLKKTEIENEARFACAQSSRYEVQDTAKATVSYPLEELYQKCLKEKGL